jgi:quinolinate synthase
MNRIDLPHLLWALEKLEQGEVVNHIKVPQSVVVNAVKSLERMLARS